MTKYSTLIITLCLSMFGFGQEIKKENLSKMKHTYWDFNKIRVQSSGKYYVDAQGETVDEHGKWTYFDRAGEVEEIRHYYKGMLFGKVTMFYPNGKKRQEGYFKWDRQDSLYHEWYETGELKVEGEYDMNQPVNEWRYYYRDGRLKSVEETKGEDNYLWEFYLPDSLHTQTVSEGNGELTAYYTTGRVKEWYNYKDGLKHGKFEELSIYGYPMLQGEFKSGEKHGTWEYAYYTGDKEKISNYVDGVLQGDYKYFYDNGQVNVEGKYDAGKKSGKWTWYTNKGTRDMEGHFTDGEQDGDWTYWYPTGELSYYAKYDMGVKTGEWTYFYKNGKKFKQGTFANDKKNGTWRTWYENETLLMEGDYLDGREEGEWVNYWETGDVKNRATFKSGQLNGDWESYFPNGTPKLTGKYKDDLKVGEWQEFFSNGKTKDVFTYKLFKKKSLVESLVKGHVTMESRLNGHSVSYSDKDYRRTEEGEYKNGVKHGEWIAYHPGGKTPAVISNYSNGELNGKMKTYSRRGKIISEADYKDGVLHGLYKLFDKRGNVTNERKYSYGMPVTEGAGGVFTPN